MKQFLKFLTICAVVIITAGSVWADTHYVDPAGSNTHPYTTPATAAHSIQDAINTANNGDIVDIADATYTITGKITVNKGVTITGNTGSPGNVVVQYSPAANSLIFDMRASNATIQGIKVMCGKSGFWFDQSAVTGCTISHCIVGPVNEYGIYMKNGGSGHTIDLCTISNTGQTYAGAPAVLIENCLDVTFSNNTLSSISDKGVFVRVCNASSVANRVEVTGNSISGCAYPCIQVYKSPYSYVYNNTISSTGDKGINIIGANAISQAERVVVEGNNISGCPWGAILVTHDRYTYIYNNTIFSTGDKGITVGNGENVNSSAERIIVEGNNVSGTKYPGIQAAWDIDYTYIHDNTLSGCNYDGADGSGDWDYASIYVAENCENTVVDNNDISDGINGIQIWSDDCTVTNNTIYDMGSTYADTKGVAGVDDGVYYNSGIIIGSNWLTSNFKPTGTTITGNSIYDNYWGLYVRDYATLSPDDESVLSVTAEKNWWGDASGPGGVGPGTGDAVSANVDYSPWWGGDYVGDDHSSAWTWGTDDNIQDAIDVATSGDFINVAVGTYPENVDIDKSITLQGAGASSCTVTAAVTTDHVFDASSVNNVEISGFTITGASSSYMAGIYMYNAKYWLISDNTITQNNKGILAAYCQYNTIRDNQITNNNGDGMMLFGCKENTIQDNDITNNGWIGIYITDSGFGGWENDDNEIIGNTIEDNGTTGIEIDAGANNLIQNNDIRNNGTYQSSSGIFLWGYIPLADGNLVLNNLIEGNTKDGVTLHMGCVNTIIQGNDILSNGGRGIYQSWNDATSTYDNVAHFNSIVGNTLEGVRNIQSIVIDATKNWWGDQTGPYHSTNTCGLGNAVSDYVDFIPWWCDETGSALGEPIFADAGHDVWIFEKSKKIKLHASGVSCGGSYSWDPEEGLSNPNIPNPTVIYSQLLEDTYGYPITYTVTVKDVNDCAQEEEDDVVVTLLNDDWNCGKKWDKVEICHYPEEPGEEEHTICISLNAVYAHLNQNPNDVLGPCVGNKSIINDELTSNPETFFVHAYPNPFKEACTIEVSITEFTNARIQVVDLFGRNVGEIFEGNLDAGVHTFTWENVNIGETNSIYFLQVFTNKETKIIKLITGQ